MARVDVCGIFEFVVSVACFVLNFVFISVYVSIFIGFGANVHSCIVVVCVFLEFCVGCERGTQLDAWHTVKYGALRASRTSFSVICEAMFVTLCIKQL